MYRLNHLRPTCALLLGGVLLLGAHSASAATYYFTDAANNQLWSNEDNWETACASGLDGQVPTSSDDAVICTGKMCEVDITTAVCDSLTVPSGAELEINVAKILTVYDDVTVNGDLDVLGTGALHFGATLGMSGSGTLQVAVNTEWVWQGDYTVTLASGMTIQAMGFCECSRSGGTAYTFVNNGTVEAGSFGRRIFTDGTIEGGSSGLFKIQGSNGPWIDFSDTTTVSSITADCEVHSGDLKINTDVCTTGELECDGGEIIVAAGTTFQAGGSCGN